MHRGDSCWLTQPERLEDGIRIKIFKCHQRLLDKDPCDRKVRRAMINQKNVDNLICLCRTKQERSNLNGLLDLYHVWHPICSKPDTPHWVPYLSGQTPVYRA